MRKKIFTNAFEETKKLRKGGLRQRPVWFDPVSRYPPHIVKNIPRENKIDIIQDICQAYVIKISVCHTEMFENKTAQKLCHMGVSTK